MLHSETTLLKVLDSLRTLRAALVTLLAGACLALPSPAPAAERAETFNAPGQRHANVCARLAASPVALRFADATPTGFTLDHLLVFEDARCPDGTVRLDLHELVPSPAGPLAFHRGGNGYFDGGNVKYGQLATSEIADPLPSPVPSSGGRGAPCPLADDQAHEVSVRSIPASMHYKRPQDVASGSNRGASFEHYGDPAADQGDREDIHYSYLLWSFVNVRGGGIVRTLLAPGQSVRLCDVDPVTMSSWDRAGAVNGTVTARYVRILAGSCPLYGWMVWSHDYFGDSAGAVAHAVAAGAAPPDPAPDPACPVAAPAAPPTVTTDGAAVGPDGSATLAGSVNPHGVVTSYRFEWGLDDRYGLGTAPATMAVADEPLPLSAAITGLQPGTTYHFRLVAESTHGVSYGPDRTLATPAAPADPPQPLEPLALSRLRVTPGTFRRPRSRRRTPARIRFGLSAPASVTLTFTRRAVGVRRGRACRPLPRRGLPRGARRCVRWVAFPRALRSPAATGTTIIRFGGWIRGRPLPRGRYRVRAVPRGEPDRVVRAGSTYFTLR